MGGRRQSVPAYPLVACRRYVCTSTSAARDRVILGLWKITWKLLHYGITLGLYWDNGRENGNYGDYRDNIAKAAGSIVEPIGVIILENQMEQKIENDMGTAN